MIDLEQLLARELSLQPMQVRNALQLRKEGGTVPFIARYRKERTGEMDEVQLHALFDRHTYLTELEERKAAILESIEKQGKLTEDLRRQIEATIQKTELEDLYLPYRPKKRTRATVAKEKGLEPLADAIRAANTPAVTEFDLPAAAAPFVSEEKGVPTIEDALAGAGDILAEEIAENAAHRGHLRTYLYENGTFTSDVKPEHAAGTTKFEMYRGFKAKAKDIHPHNVLALMRGEKENVVAFSLTFDEEVVFAYLRDAAVHAAAPSLRAFYEALVRDAFERLMRPSLVGEVRALCKESAERESITTFESNLRQLLLSPPAGMKPTLGIDPGLRPGCKIVVLDATGKFVAHATIYPHKSPGERTAAVQTLTDLIRAHEVELIAIGNGTGGRETESFVTEVLAAMDRKPVRVMVNEAGASVYSASPIARGEFPDLDVSVRGAVSIGRRLQDPLAELVKIDPKSIGVGQYQHDVDQRLLRKRLEETVESCVNYVGVDVNTASRELLKYVAGVNTTIAKNVVAYRNEHGPYKSREELRQVPKFGPKTFEQAAGFLRIRDGGNPLDNSAVHPESYPIAEKILADLGMTIQDVVLKPDRLASVKPGDYVTEMAGEPTVRDILDELKKPGRDPRAEFRYATFKDGVKELKDLTPGMELEGVVTNVTNFGAFVDIGVHQDGLVHVSQIADRFVQDPKSIVHVGEVVKVRVLEVNTQLKRISLTMKGDSEKKEKHERSHRPGKKGKPAEKAPRFTIEDLKRKFSNR
ncbi:MAG: RNA-binding transcriptional accessory protein [Bacteroidetes bacterium]|nr:RNA-binding transcriptional accessory protein [Bacteroidota bacterium]